MTKDPIEKLGPEGLKAVINYMIDSIPRHGEEVNFDLKIPENKKKVDRFNAEAEKLFLDGWKQYNYGVRFRPRWDEKYGFVFWLSVDSAFTFQDDDKTRTFIEKFDIIHKQIQILKKARKYLARLIRLKEKLGLPGAVKEDIPKHRDLGDDGEGTYYTPISQEMLDDILKH